MWIYVKKYCPKFLFTQGSFFVYFFCFNIYKMVDSMDIYKSLNINPGTVMRNSEIVKFISDHLKTKKLCKHAVKKLPSVIRLNKCVIKLF